jgi:uncharacterized SAM-binding protein YcdF (DUF218 family)
MFFLVSKIFWLFAQPSSVLLMLLLAAAVLLFTRYERAGRRLVVASAALLLIFGISPLGNWLILPLEDRFPRADLSGRAVDGIVVLGGGEDARTAAGRHVHALTEAAEGITETAALARRFPKSKIVFTSGSVSILSAPLVGADAAKPIFQALGIGGDDRLILERESRNTWENAVYTKALVNPKPGERWLLVTRAAHMPRSMGAFRKAGFPVEAWPVDYRTANSWDALTTFDVPSDGLKRVEETLHEWVGLLAYRLTGRSDALLPGP